MTNNWNSAEVVVVLGKSGLVTKTFTQVDVEDGPFLSCWNTGSYCQIPKEKVSMVYINLNINGKNQHIACWENPDYSEE